MDDPQITQKGLLARSLDRVQKINAIWKAITGLVAIPIGIWGAWHWLTPNISITPSVIASSVSPLETEYIIKNNGHISLYEVELGCAISTHEVKNYTTYGNTLDVPGLSMSQYIPLLVPGGVASRNCGGYPMTSSPRMTYPATIIIWASAKWPWPWPLLSWMEADHFKSVKDSDGHIQISPDTP
jgi:hypothetical protein